MGATVYRPYAVRYETDAMSATPALLGGITQQSIVTDATDSLEVSAGSAYPMIANITQMACKARFTTRNIAAALANLTPPVVVLANSGVQMWQVKTVDGVVQSGSVHRVANIADGCIVPRRLTVDAGGHAELEYEVLAEWDATNDPLAWTESQAMPSETLTDAERFGMGKFQVGGVEFDGKLSLEVDFGITGNQIQTDGDIFPRHIEVPEQLTRITVRGINTAKLADSGAIPLEGKTGTQANSWFVLRKRADGAYASGSNHIQGAVDGLAYAEDVWDAQGNQRGECSIVMLVRYDGTNSPITFDTGYALP